MVAQFVITLVESPERVLSECHRVLRPSGKIILVNHFYSETGLAASIERWAAPPHAVFLGAQHGVRLAEIYADVFVFPSRTDTFGLVLLEALASGLPIAAFPAAGPKDVIGHAPVGAIDDDLARACLAALDIPRNLCLEFAEHHTWRESARLFVKNAVDAPSDPVTASLTNGRVSRSRERPLHGQHLTMRDKSAHDERDLRITRHID